MLKKLPALAFLVCASIGSFAATPEEVQEAERDRDLAKAKQETAEANAARAKANIGELSSQSLPTGSGTATALNIEGKILAYRAVDAVASDIATQVLNAAPKATNIVIFGDAQFSAITRYWMFRTQLSKLNKSIVQIVGGNLDEPRLPGLSSDESLTSCKRGPVKEVIPPLIAVAAGLQVLSLFKTDKVMTGTDVSDDDFALSSAVVGKLKSARPSLNIVYPTVYVPNAFPAVPRPEVKSAVLDAVDELERYKGALDRLSTLIDSRKKTLAAAIGSAKTSASCKSMYETDVKTLERMEQSNKTLQKLVSNNQEFLSKVDDKSGSSVLQDLYIAETLTSNFKSAYVLKLKTVAAGGATLAEKNLFTTNFYFSGGAIISYMLLDGQSGEIVSTAVLPRYAQYVKANDFR